MQVAECWKEMVKALQTPLDHPIEAFMLPDHAERIRRFRDVLRSPIAQRLAEQQDGGDFYGAYKGWDSNTRYFLGFRNCVHMLPARDQERPSVVDSAEKGGTPATHRPPLTHPSPTPC